MRAEEIRLDFLISEEKRSILYDDEVCQIDAQLHTTHAN